MATAAAFAGFAALVIALVLPIPGWILVCLALVAGVLGWWFGVATSLAVSYRLGNRRSRREIAREYERRTGMPFPGWPKKKPGDEPPDGIPAGL